MMSAVGTLLVLLSTLFTRSGSAGTAFTLFVAGLWLIYSRLRPSALHETRNRTGSLGVNRAPFQSTLPDMSQTAR